MAFLWISRAGSSCCKSTSGVVSRSIRRLAYARGPAVRLFGLLDRARCYPIRFLNGPDNYDARLLSLEGPTPRARTYADRLSENSREVTLVAEAALRGHIR